MASIREVPRGDGGTTYQVLYRIDGRQSSTPLADRESAEYLKELIKQVGVERALDIHGLSTAAIRKPKSGLTLATWLDRHIEHLTGVQKNTVETYKRFVKRDINPQIGSIPLTDLSRDDIKDWVNSLEGSAKTIKNKHGFLSGALAAAVQAELIPANPCARVRLPRWNRQEIMFLSKEDYAQLKNALTEYWRPLVEFLVSTGCRFGEAAALQPAHVDRKAHTVRIVQAWKYSSAGYEIGVPKTKRSVRTINVDPALLEQLDYSHAWLFVNRDGGPVRIHGFHPRVWRPAVERSGLDPWPRIHDLRHTHASWLIAGNVPLPVIQRRLGHESITTTIDLYGHLDRSADKLAAEAIKGFIQP